MGKKDANGLLTADTVLAEAKRAGFEVVTAETPAGMRGQQRTVEILLGNPKTAKTETISATGRAGATIFSRDRVIAAFAAVL